MYKKLANKIASGEEKIALVGLGYVGMPIAVEFARRGAKVIGFDYNKEKIDLYQRGIDPTKEVGDDVIKTSTVDFTSDAARLSEAKFIIVAVPTPVRGDNTPDLRFLEGASTIVGQHVTKGTVVVFESTVYPGVTEEVCAPIIQKESGLLCGLDWKIGYSPERINPGDKQHRLNNITKIVSGMDDESLEIISDVYGMVVDAGVYKAESITVAEAAKVIENSQRDINIAFMNELSVIFHKMGIDTKAVLEAAGTKWNFLPFRPGLVGGHCIGIDPYYLTYKAEKLGYHSQIILSGRRINDGMGKYCAEQLVKLLIKNDIQVRNARVAILGFTFKENCPDIRNTKVIDIICELKEFGIDPMIFDPVGDAEEAKRLYNIKFCLQSDLNNMDAVLIAVKHDEFVHYKPLDISKLYNSNRENKVLMDIKGLYNKQQFRHGWDYWRL